MRTGCGSFKNAIAILEADDSDDARSVVEVWRSIGSWDKRRLPAEAIVIKSGLSYRRFIEVVTGAIVQQSQDVTRMMIAVAQPKVMQTTIRRATKRMPIMSNTGAVVGYEEGDLKAQELFGKISGIVPIPKGSQTIIQMGQVNNGQQAELESGSDEPKELETMDEMLMDMQDVIRPQLQAPIESNSIIPANAPEVEYLEI